MVTIVIIFKKLLEKCCAVGTPERPIRQQPSPAYTTELGTRMRRSSPSRFFLFFFFFHSNSRGQFLFLAFFRCVFCHVLLVCFSLVFFDETTSQEPWFEHVAFLCFETQILYCD